MRVSRAVLASAAMFLALASGCGGSSSSSGETAASAPADMMEMKEAAMAPVMAAPPAPVAEAAFDEAARAQAGGAPQAGPAGQASQPSQAETGRLIAYSYSRSFRAPADRIETLVEAHKAACESAGPAQCYVVGSNVSGLGTEYISGNLELKGSPAWVKGFLSTLPESLKPFNANVDGSWTGSEDLTSQIVDTTARLNARKTLRDRLEKLLRDRPGNLEELLAVERELANVQAEIDSTESYLAQMRLRVDMSALSLTYQAKGSAVSESVWRPLGDAFGGFFAEFASAMAAVVTFIARILPWLPVLAGLAWAAMWGWRRVRRGRKAAPADAQSAKAG